MPSGRSRRRSLACVPILFPLELLLAAQQVSVHKIKELLWGRWLDVAIAVSAVFVDQHYVETGSGDV